MLFDFLVKSCKFYSILLFFTKKYTGFPNKLFSIIPLIFFNIFGYKSDKNFVKQPSQSIILIFFILILILPNLF